MTLFRIVDRQRHAFCRTIAVAIAAFVAVSAITAQDDLSDEPFTVFVAHDKAFARCGPSGEYYRTDALRHGQQLKVYLETDDGWLGVRPPTGSFCWIPSSAVELSKGGEKATVIEDRTVSWIGTHLGRARQYRWQVQLAEGESLTILGRSERDGPDGPQTWFRIVPPSGEFRWVHRDQIVESAEELVASLQERPASRDDLDVEPIDRQTRQAKAELPENGIDAILQTANTIKERITGRPNANASSRRNPEGSPRPTDLVPLAVDQSPQLQPAPIRQTQAPSQPQGSKLSENVIGSGIRHDIRAIQVETPIQSAAIDVTDAAAAEFVSRPRLTDIGADVSAPQNNVAAGDANWVLGTNRLSVSNQDAIQPAGFNEPNTHRSAVARAVAAESITRVEQEASGANVDQLQLIFSRLMARGASAAEVEPVARHSRDFAEKTFDHVAAGRARLLAERAQQYQRVARRRDGSTVIRENGVPVIPASNRTNASVGLNTTPTNQMAHSESGYLVQVYSARPNSPPYALTDDAGNTIAYLTPQPGLNLRNHLNSHVKVIGQKGFLQGLNTPHIVVTQAGRLQR